MHLERIDHLVLTVQNIKASYAFYTKVLGMKAVAFQGGRKALRPTSGSADLCFIAREPLAKIISHLDNCGVKIIEGPVEITGAMGPMTSIYIRDPDQNLIEIAVYNQETRKKKG